MNVTRLPLALAVAWPAFRGVAGEAPQVFRTFMPAAGPSAFAVELTPELALCYDGLRGGVNQAWRGTIDLAPTLRAKINQPALPQSVERLRRQRKVQSNDTIIALKGGRLIASSSVALTNSKSESRSPRPAKGGGRRNWIFRSTARPADSRPCSSASTRRGTKNWKR